MKRLLFILGALSIVLIFTACQQTEKTPDKNEKTEEESEFVTKGIIDDMNDTQILITLTDSPTNVEKGDRMYFNIENIGTTTLQQLKRGQHVSITHGPQMTMSLPPIGVAEKLTIEDDGLSKTPHATIYTFDQGKSDFHREHDITGEDVDTLVTFTDNFDWQKLDQDITQPLTYAYTLNATKSSANKEQIALGTNGEGNDYLLRTKTEQFVVLTPEQKEALDTLLFPEKTTTDEK